MPSGPEVRAQVPPSRYEGRPLLIILESYVLVVIDVWPAKKDKALQDLVQGLWGGGSDWMGTVRKELALDAAMDDQITRNWAAYQEAKRAQGQSGSAAEYARMFADAITAQTEQRHDKDE